MSAGREKSKLASSFLSEHRKILLLTSVEAALVVTVVSVLAMEQLSPRVGIDVFRLMQGLGTKARLVLREPVWQQVVFLPRELLILLQGRV